VEIAERDMGVVENSTAGMTEHMLARL
jgi:hypothetical protein